MENYTVKQIESVEEVDLSKGLYLTVLHAKRIPPHMALLLDGDLFGLDVKGPNIIELEKLERSIDKKCIKSLFFKLDVPGDYPNLSFYNKIKECFSKYGRVEVNMVTCLNPVKDFLNWAYNIDTDDTPYLFNLLPKLYNAGVVTGCYQENMSTDVVDGEFSFRTYTMFEINQMIQQVSKDRQTVSNV